MQGCKKNIAKIRWKFSPKLFCILICLFLLPTILVSHTFTYLIRQDVLGIASGLYADSLHRSSNYIDEYIDQLRINSATLAVDNNVRSFFLMQELPKGYADYRMLRDTYSELQYCVELSNDVVQNIYVYNTVIQLFRSTTREFSYKDLRMQNHPEWQEMFAHEFGLFNNSELVEAITGNRNSTLAIKSVIFNGIPRGFIAMELNPSTLSKLFTMEESTLGTSFFLSGRDSSVVISGETKASSPELAEVCRTNKNSVSSRINADGTDYLWTQHSSSVLDKFTYNLFIPIKNLEHNVTAHIVSYSWIMYGILLLLIVISAGWTTASIFTPIVYLKNLLSENTEKSEIPNSMIDKAVLSDMRQIITNMHTQINISNAAIADIRTENELLRGNLTKKDRALADLVVRKILNQEPLNEEDSRRLLDDIPEGMRNMFCMTIINCDDGFEAAQFLLEKFERFNEAHSPEAMCRFLCATHCELYFLICINTAEAWRNSAESRYQELFSRFIDEAKLDGYRVYIAMGDLSQGGPGSIVESLISAREKLRYKYMMPNSGLLTDIGAKEFLMPIQHEAMRNFEAALSTSKLEEALAIVRDHDQFLSRQQVSPKLCLLFQQMMLYALLNHLFTIGKHRTLSESVYDRMIHFDRYFRNYAEANTYICECLLLLQGSADDGAPRNYAMQAMAILESVGLQDIRLQEIANQLGVSEAHLSRQFKATYGINFKEYLINVKLQQARIMLSKDDCSLKEICEYIGYEDVKQFSRIFKKYEGITPLQYRSKIKNTDNGTT